ncbi:MAG: uroporphyrinogen decarboxylase family protein [Hyphomicrobiales bacterium]|nr:uroporphyrinogen decarboxylase family protein [Hyphomicrobiales bacterium]
MTWTHRERIMAALNHEEPDRVPIDFGGAEFTTITLAGYEKLKKYMGVDTPTDVMSIIHTCAHPAEEILNRFDVDTRNVQPGPYEGGVDHWIDDNTYVDIFNVLWKRTEKAVDQHFLHQDGPFHGGKLTIDQVEEYDWPDGKNPGLVKGVRERVEQIKANGDHAVCLYLPGGVIHRGYAMRGFESYLKDLYKQPEALQRLMDKLCDFWCDTAESMIEAAGPENVDIIYFGEDLGTQDSCMFDPDTIYKEYLKPRHRRMVELVKGLTNNEAKVCYHCCGSAYQFIPHLLDIGVDALNPVQVTAKQMEPERLKEAFGDRLTFWGGINTQQTLPFGTPEEVVAETKRIINILGKGGGYILNSVHNIQAEVPPENIVAMFETGVAHRYH